MQRTVWTLLLALLLQLVAGSAWAVQRTTPAAAVACHEMVVTGSADMHAHAATSHSNPDRQGAHTAPANHPHATDSHHCCFVGLGVGLQPQWVPLPHPAPEAPHRSWASLSLRPDLRPPI